MGGGVPRGRHVAVGQPSYLVLTAASSSVAMLSGAARRGALTLRCGPGIAVAAGVSACGGAGVLVLRTPPLPFKPPPSTGSETDTLKARSMRDWDRGVNAWSGS